LWPNKEVEPIKIICVLFILTKSGSFGGRQFQKKNQELEKTHIFLSIEERERERERKARMASFLQTFLDPKKNWFAAQHMKSVSRRLRRYGQSLLPNPNFRLSYVN
jgi:hypothetical protein